MVCMRVSYEIHKFRGHWQRGVPEFLFHRVGRDLTEGEK